MLLNSREGAEKDAYKFGCEGAHQMGNKWDAMQSVCANISIKKEVFIPPILDRLSKFYIH